ncbi:MAG: M48 family metallopeptidase [Lentimicrobiaceae bacterium]|jgi:STE24 endopeptidase|nr:M48 family metallopeptidase [Lentimicrobiaceae bacterium]
MAALIFNIIIGIVIISFLFERIMEWLNTTQSNGMLPDKLAGIYDAEKYRKQQAYEKENYRFSFVYDTFSFLIMIAMLLLGGFAWLNSLLQTYTMNPILLAILFFGFIGWGADILSIPFSAYHTFVIEEKFGFNKTSVKTFILDKIKMWLLGAVIGGGILALIVFIYTATGQWFWVLTWLAISLFSIFMTMFYSTLIVPLFNKQKPLEEGELRNAIEDFARKTGFSLDAIFVIDGSKRSGKANAYFSGLGRKKRIVLYDTLIQQHTTGELVAILAHEIGHYKLKHTTKSMLLSVAHTGLLLYLVSLFISSPLLSQALGATTESFHIGILAFGLLYSPLSTLTGIALNKLSRKHEYQADIFTGNNYNAETLINALKKLSVNNLSNLTPHPAYVFIYYSHPTLLQRIIHLEKINNE